MKKMLVVCLVMAMLFGFSVMAGAQMPADSTVDIYVNVAQHAEITKDANSISLSVDKATGVTSEDLIIGWNLQTNCTVKATVASRGFQDAAGNPVATLNNLVNYVGSGYGYKGDPFAAGTTFNVPYSAPRGNWNANLAVVFDIEGYKEDGDWYKLEAGDYSDVITVTIAAN